MKNCIREISKKEEILEKIVNEVNVGNGNRKMTRRDNRKLTHSLFE